MIYEKYNTCLYKRRARIFIRALHKSYLFFSFINSIINLFSEGKLLLSIFSTTISLFDMQAKGLLLALTKWDDSPNKETMLN